MRAATRALTWVVAAAIGALGVAAAVDGLTGGAEPALEAGPPRHDRLRGPDVPPPGALAGRLVIAGRDGCKLQLLDLATLTLGKPGPAVGCRLWVSPRGDLAATAGPPGKGELRLVRLGDRPTFARRLGQASSPPSWAPDGGRLAWCAGNETLVLDVDGGGTEVRRGCYPTFAPDGTLVTRARTETGLLVLRDDEVIVEPEVGDGRQVVGHGVLPDGRLALAVHRRTGAGFDFAIELELWGGSRLDDAVPINSYGVVAQAFGLHVEPAPGGAEAAVTSPGSLVAPRPDDLVSLVDFRLGGPVAGLTERPYAGVAWSPDGAWLALSTGREILVFGLGRGEPAYVLPVAARALAWR